MYAKPIYIVDGARTPFLKSKNRPGPFAAADLATQAGRHAPAAPARRARRGDPGCAAPSVDEVNIGRVAALRMGCGQKVPGWTVMRNCARHGGRLLSTTSSPAARSSAPAVRARARPCSMRTGWSTGFPTWPPRRPLASAWPLFHVYPSSRPRPVIGIRKGLTDPMVGRSGQTAENLAYASHHARATRCFQSVLSGRQVQMKAG
jgi:acetyl-CoA C-acetyltransferase